MNRDQETAADQLEHAAEFIREGRWAEAIQMASDGLFWLSRTVWPEVDGRRGGQRRDVAGVR